MGEPDARIDALLPELIAGRPAVLRVASRSMLPLLREGDEVRLRPCAPARLRAGQIVVFAHGGRLWVHRVVRNDPRGWLDTRGDVSSWIEGPIPHDAVLGRVVARRRPGGSWKRLDTGALALYGLIQATLAPGLAGLVPGLRRLFGRRGLVPLARVLRPTS